MPPRSAEHAARYLTWCKRHRLNPLKATPRHIAAFRAHIEDGTPGERPCRPGTVRQYLTSIRSLYRILEYPLDLLPGHNPARHIRLPRYTPPGQRRATDVERRAVLDAARRWRGPMANRNRAVIAVLVYCVPRVGEICYMRVTDFTDTPAGGAWLEWAAEKDGHRTVRVPAPAADALPRWLAG
ncbi:tyrosine-type recombinase/integrase [Streptomyces sp. NPDC057680]|uniref:tyrosine-type recombinase/integrase n=1 Tax=Streptomyces sp. NPDC057680 TaxID=3346208 RepID=UPI0036B50E3E